jgi:Phage phiEco32-like COOH.NH2 ligase-type 2
MVMASKKTAPEALKAPPERDAITGRFKSKVTEILKVSAKNFTKAVKSVTKDPNVKKILTKDLTSLFSRGKPRGGKNIFLRAISTSTTNIKDRYGYIISYGFTLSDQDKEVVLNSAQDYSNGTFYLTYDSLNDGAPRAVYFNGNFEWEHIHSEHKDYASLLNKHEDIFLKNLHRHLWYDGRIGSDPEIFAESATGNMIPAFLFLPGKDKPAKTPNWEKHFNNHGNCAMYWDGFQAEYTTKPDTCLGYHGDSIAAGMRGVYDAVRKRFKDSKLSMRSVFHLSPEVLEGALEEHVEFGCMPSYNAYGLTVKMPPAREVPFRSAGGHIHFGIGKKSHAQAAPIIKALDAVLGVACVSLFAEFDDPNRRKLYGLPGEYRLPKHGVEYRPLSNAWLSHPLIMNLVIDLSRKALVFGKEGYFEKYWKASEEEVISCMINCDVKAAHKMMERNKEIFLQLLKASYSSAQSQELEMLYQVFIKGIRSAVKDPLDLTANWKLEKGWKPHVGGHGEPNVRTFLSARRISPKYKM